MNLNLYLGPDNTRPVRDSLGTVPTSRPKDRYIWLLASQTSLGTLYSSALLGSLTDDGKFSSGFMHDEEED